MKKGEITLSICFILMSIYAIVTASHFPTGSSGVPGPGYFPIIVSSLMIILSLVVIITSIINNKSNDKSHNEFNIKSTVITVITTILFLILWNRIHFIADCSLYIIILGILYGKKLKFLIPISIVSSSIVYLIFSNVLNVMLTH